MSNWYVSSASWTAVSAWAASTAYTVGQYVRQNATPTVGNERVFRVTTAGTSGATEPTWTLTKNGTTTDGGVTWTECTGQEAYQSPGAWRPFARLSSAAGFGAAGDTFYIGSSHAETQASQISVSFSGAGPTGQPNIICVDESASGSVPPTSANITTGASLTTTGSSNIVLTANFGLIQGINFNVGTGTGSTILAFNANGYYKNGVWALPATGASSVRTPQSSGAWAAVLDNISFKFSSASQQFQPAARVIWRNSVALASGSSVPSTFFGPSNTPDILCEGVDFSGIPAGSTLISGTGSGGKVVFKNCKLASGVTIASSSSTAIGAVDVSVINCDSGTGYYRNERYAYGGTLTTDPAITRTGGASDGGTSISHKIVTNTGASWATYFEAFPIAIYNSTTNATVTVTVCGIANAAALPTNDQFWLQVSYLGSASSPIATINNATKSNILATGTSLTADTSAWDANVASRANSTAYTVGQTIKTASNPGRVFFCTSAGTSASSEPAGYASAVDGGSVTDGTATFRAGVRFKQSVPLSSPTPAAAGLITVTPKVGAASFTCYVDPLITLS